MNQSIDKLANLLLARKAIHSLPANTSLTLREFNALVIEWQGNKTNAIETMVSSSSPPSTMQSFSGIRSSSSNSSQNLYGDEVYHRHPHQAPLSVTTKPPLMADHHSQFESTSSSRFQVTVRQLSSSSKPKQ